MRGVRWEPLGKEQRVDHAEAGGKKNRVRWGSWATWWTRWGVGGVEEVLLGIDHDEGRPFA